MMTTAMFQKGDRVEFKEFPEVAAGKIVGLWKRGFYKVTWESGLTYQGDHHRERECHSKGGLNPHAIGRSIARYRVAVARLALAAWIMYERPLYRRSRIRGTGPGTRRSSPLYISQSFGVLREGCANLCPSLRPRYLASLDPLS
jgi:hypothetical protein